MPVLGDKSHVDRIPLHRMTKKENISNNLQQKNIHTVLCCIQDLLWEARSSAPPSLEFLFSITNKCSEQMGSRMTPVQKCFGQINRPTD